jgi:molybdate transport system permease protein
MEGIDERLVQVSRLLGARRLDRIITVIVPLSVRGIIAGSVLMFARGLGEFGATIIVAGNIPGVTQTIPLAIYEYASSPKGDIMALSLCAVSISISVVVLVFHEWLGRRIVRSD